MVLMTENKKPKRPHPIINTLATEWEFLGKRKRTFSIYMVFFSIAGIVSLITPFLIGTIFNDIQRSITTQQELTSLHWKMAALLLVTAYKMA